MTPEDFTVLACFITAFAGVGLWFLSAAEHRKTIKQIEKFRPLDGRVYVVYSTYVRDGEFCEIEGVFTDKARALYAADAISAASDLTSGKVRCTYLDTSPLSEENASVTAIAFYKEIAHETRIKGEAQA